MDPLAFRYLVLTSHYRNRLNFTDNALQSATVALDKLRALFEKRIKGGKVAHKFKKKFEEVMFDDLNTAEGLAVVWAVVKSDLSEADKQATILDFDKVLGLDLANYKPSKIPAEVRKLAEQRVAMRKKKDWAEADKLREKIEALGFEIKDTATAYQLTKK
jgi:cysteinyl-tRNA synthetase